MTLTGEAPARRRPIVFGTDGWRARIADDFTFENVRRCADGVAAYVVERGEQAKGVVVAYDRRFASEHFAMAAAEVLLAHDIPVAFAVHAVPDPDELVRGRRARRGGRHRHHRQPQPVDRQRLQGQGADGLGGRPRHPRRSSRRRLAANGGDRDRARGRSPTPRRPAWSSGSTRTRATSGSSAGRSTSTRCKAADMSMPRRADVGRRERLDLAPARRRPDPGHRDPPGAQPVLRRRQPRADPAEHRRGARASSPAAATTSGLLLDGDADRAGAADERGTFIHQLQVTGLLMYYLAEHRGLREPVVVSVNNTSMAARLGERYGIDVHETPVGFKFIGPKMIETGAMMGAEESGGFGFGMHLPERDGDLRRPAAARPVPARAGAPGAGRSRRSIEHFHEIAGPSFYRRVDVHVDRAAYPDVEAPPAGRPARARRRPRSPGSRSPGRCRSTRTTASSSSLDDGSWLLDPRSGTEPLVRVYTEATSEDAAGRAPRRRRAAGPRR